MLTVFLNVILFLLKFIVGRLGNSVSVTADAFNNLTDAMTAGLAMIGMQIASCGGGNKHENGHGRFEWIIALLTAMSVILVGWELLKDSILTIFSPRDTNLDVFMAVVLLCSIAVKVFLWRYSIKKSRIHDSQALRAVAIDSLSDAVSTGAVLLSLLLSAAWKIDADGWCGLAVSLFIIVNGVKAFQETANRIMGTRAPKEEILQVEELAKEGGRFRETYDLRIEDYGYGRRCVLMDVEPAPDTPAGRSGL